MNPNPDVGAHGRIPIWNAETGLFDDYNVGDRIRSIGRTISEGDAMHFNALVLDMHPYVGDDHFAREEGIFHQRIVAGAMTFSVGLGLLATNNVHAFSYGYDRLRFLAPVYFGDTIYGIRTVLEKRPKSEAMGLIRFAYEVFKTDGVLTLYCEHLQTVQYRRQTNDLVGDADDQLPRA